MVSTCMPMLSAAYAAAHACAARKPARFCPCLNVHVGVGHQLAVNLYVLLLRRHLDASKRACSKAIKELSCRYGSCTCLPDGSHARQPCIRLGLLTGTGHSSRDGLDQLVLQGVVKPEDSVQPLLGQSRAAGLGRLYQGHCAAHHGSIEAAALLHTRATVCQRV